MTSQPNTDAKLTETERAAISIESRVLSLTAAVYFLITAILVGGGMFAILIFPNETRSGVDALDDDIRQIARWMVYAPLGSLGLGAYFQLAGLSLRGKLIQRPSFHH